ncbi:uncharacterized protein BcabD6B2_10710 [Babesia caballi]|uniref:Uncharacterized protein n=1 Tax=Babesia caballi TaxID=5871 RepID=A0AAV4LNM4_BABCB|nr:hypothetical protein, conserved [Babesia caballi]
MFRLTGQLRGPGHASCKELSVVTQDGPARRLRFRLKPIKHDFGRVLCMADAKTLRRAADEVLRETGSGTRQRVLPQEWTLHQDDMGARAAAKSQAFWTVFSKRFKASVPILSAADTVHVLRAFHALNKDTGELHYGSRPSSSGVYVAAAPTIRGKVQELDKRSLLDGLHILSRRLKTNTQQQLFRAMADQVPNVLWQMSGEHLIMRGNIHTQPPTWARPSGTSAGLGAWMDGWRLTCIRNFATAPRRSPISVGCRPGGA